MLIGFSLVLVYCVLVVVLGFVCGCCLVCCCWVIDLMQPECLRCGKWKVATIELITAIAGILLV